MATGSRGLLTEEAFAHILQQTAPTAHTMLFYFQGEPLLNNSLPRYIRMAHEAGLYTLVSTNAQALDRAMARRLVAAGLDRLIVSLDGLTQETYQAYRQGGSLQRALDGLRYAASAKKARHSRMTIELQVLLLRSNEQEWPQFRRQYRALGADRLTFKTAQFYNYEQGNALMPTDERYSRYRRGKDERWHPKQSPKGVCRRMLTGCVIACNGDVLPCCYDKAHAHVLGNIFSDHLCAIWHDEKARRFRRAVLAHAETIAICRNCVR